MASHQHQDWSGVWILVGVIVFVTFCVNLFSSNSTSPQPSGLLPPPTNNSAEMRYVENRFRQEGYSPTESRQAAEAVMKFHQAQQNRR